VVFADEIGSSHASGEMCGLTIAKSAYSATQIKAIYDSGVPVTVPHANHEILIAGDNEYETRINASEFSVGDVTDYLRYDTVNGLVIAGNGSGVTNIDGGNITTGQLTINSTSGITALVVSDGTNDKIKIDEINGINFMSVSGYLPVKWIGIGGMYSYIEASTITDYQDLEFKTVGLLGGTISLSGGIGGYEDAIVEIGKTYSSDPTVTIKNISGTQNCKLVVEGFADTSTGYKVNGTSVIDSSGNVVTESWQTPSFQNSWVNYGSSFNPAGYYKDRTGRVHLRGLVKSGTLLSTIFTLPSGYRPPYKEIFLTIAYNNAAIRVDIRTTGEVAMITGGSTAWLALDGISFRAV